MVAFDFLWQVAISLPEMGGLKDGLRHLDRLTLGGRNQSPRDRRTERSNMSSKTVGANCRNQSPRDGRTERKDTALGISGDGRRNQSPRNGRT